MGVASFLEVSPWQPNRCFIALRAIITMATTDIGNSSVQVISRIYLERERRVWVETFAGENFHKLVTFREKKDYVKVVYPAPLHTALYTLKFSGNCRSDICDQKFQLYIHYQRACQLECLTREG